MKTKLVKFIILLQVSLLLLHVTCESIAEDSKNDEVDDLVCINSESEDCKHEYNSEEIDEEDDEYEEVVEYEYEIPYNKYVLDPCSDLDTNCASWMNEGHCEDPSKDYMLRICQKTCKVCLDMEDLTDCTFGEECDCDDFADACSTDAFHGKCLTDAEYMKENCPMSCGHCIPFFDLGVTQDLEDQSESILQFVRKSHTYLLEEVMINSRYARVRHLCINEESLCTQWANEGQCEANPTYMHYHCPLACRTCDLLDIDIRCPLDHVALNEKNVWKQGDVDKMFNNIMNNPYYAKYEPKLLSKPTMEPQIASNTDNIDNTDKCSLWILSLENFLTEEECDRFIEVAAAEGYERSETVDQTELGLNGEYEGALIEDRTSENAWCHEICKADPVMIDVMERIVNITGIPTENQEDFQLLRYEVGQFYASHTDYIPFRAEGPRIATFFIYLNNVTSGGETAFPNLGIKVTPKKGKAILYPSVKNIDPMEEDLCSEHESLPVLEGIKHAANVWIHMRNHQNADDDCERIPDEEED